MGIFRGLITSWSANCKLLNSFSICSSITTEIYSLDLDRCFSILNMYGLCDDKVSFWYKIFGLQVLQFNSFIMSGDLNLTVGRFENWGPKA